MGMPIARLTSVAPTPIEMERRVPISNRLSTSRPNSSVPSQYVAFGGRKRVLSEIVSHGCGAIHGASNPSRMMAVVMTSPALSCNGNGLRAPLPASSAPAGVALGNGAVIPDLRIEPRIKQVGDQIRDGVHGGDDQ